MTALTLFQFGPSVYSWAARIACRAKGLEPAVTEIDPFDVVDADRLRAIHPFGRVPVLQHAEARIYETAAILAYVDAAFAGPSLGPDSPLGRARAVQVGAIADHYGYWPLVRQVFAHGRFRPLCGEPSDVEVMAAGLAAADPVLCALDAIAAEGAVLTGDGLTTADCHLFPMIDYFAQVDEGAEALERHAALHRWHAKLTLHPAMRDTRPDLEALAR